tara:strand:- start:97 stop:672 length:576 start_codon:yes stop_codon:yes gene_type:complete
MSTITQAVLNKARKDKFILCFTLPKALREVDAQENGARENERLVRDSLQFSVYGTVVPKVNVNAIEQSYSGQVFKFSGHHRPEYGNITVNFVVDNMFNNYWVIYKWINLMNNNKEAFFYKEKMPVNASPFSEYATTFTLYGLDEYENRKIQFDYIGVVPVGLGDIKYNYQDPEQIESTFEFSFSQLIAKLL